MPESFNKCVESGGRVRTKQLGGSKYMYICFKDGESHAGEVHKKEKLPTRKQIRKDIKRGK